MPECRYSIKMGRKVTERTISFRHLCRPYSFPSLPSPSYLFLLSFSRLGKSLPGKSPQEEQQRVRGRPRACSSSQRGPREESWATGHSRVSLKETNALARVCACLFTGSKDLTCRSELKWYFLHFRVFASGWSSPLQARADHPLPCNRALLRYHHVLIT